MNQKILFVTTAEGNQVKIGLNLDFEVKQAKISWEKTLLCSEKTLLCSEKILLCSEKTLLCSSTPPLCSSKITIVL